MQVDMRDPFMVAADAWICSLSNQVIDSFYVIKWYSFIDRIMIFHIGVRLFEIYIEFYMIRFQMFK
jgi:hypothetical protein